MLRRLLCKRRLDSRLRTICWALGESIAIRHSLSSFLLKSIYRDRDYDRALVCLRPTMSAKKNNEKKHADLRMVLSTFKDQPRGFCQQFRERVAREEECHSLGVAVGTRGTYTSASMRRSRQFSINFLQTWQKILF
jgi:hypothetical protein